MLNDDKSEIPRNGILDGYFRITERKSTIPREFLAGAITFMAMSYILCVQPAIMSGKMFGMNTGMNAMSLITTTCILSAAASFLMGLWANYPIGLAPGMGENIFVVLTVIPACATVLGGKVGDDSAWQLALGVVFVSGFVFAVVSFLNIRKLLIEAITPSLRSGISAGIGLFITLLGLQHAGLVVCENNLYVLGSLKSSDAFVFGVGLITTVVLFSLKHRGSLLYGIFVSAIAAALFGKIAWVQPVGVPVDPRPILCKMDIVGVVKHLDELFPLVIVLTFMAVFDTLGTVVAVGTRAGLIKENEFPNVEKVFAVDATATMIGAVAGHSTTTAYIESAAGVESGGRTGLAAISTAGCFLLAMFFAPLIAVVGNYPPITAAALVVVGALMMQSASRIDWDDFSESVPAFLLLVGIPFSYSIANGLIPGLIVYPFIKLCCGKGRSVGWVLYLIAALLILYAVFVMK